jgi:hypothetical protein
LPFVFSFGFRISRRRHPAFGHPLPLRETRHAVFMQAWPRNENRPRGMRPQGQDCGSAASVRFPPGGGAWPARQGFRVR